MGSRVLADPAPSRVRLGDLPEPEPCRRELGGSAAGYPGGIWALRGGLAAAPGAGRGFLVPATGSNCCLFLEERNPRWS